MAFRPGGGWRPWAVAVLIVAGCGGSADEDAVRATIERLERALREGDAPGVCRLYTHGRAFCRAHFGPAELRAVGFGGRIEVTDVEIDGESATAAVENIRGGRRVAGSTRLRKVGDDWLLVPPD